MYRVYLWINQFNVMKLRYNLHHFHTFDMQRHQPIKKQIPEGALGSSSKLNSKSLAPMSDTMSNNNYFKIVLRNTETGVAILNFR